MLTASAESIYLTGSVSALTNWGTSNPILLSSANYPIWSSTYPRCVQNPRLMNAALPSLATVNLPANTAIQYKYISIDNGQVTWESDPNNSFTTGASGAQTLNDVWR